MTENGHGKAWTGDVSRIAVGVDSLAGMCAATIGA